MQLGRVDLIARKLTINHETTSRTDTTSTDEPAFGGTFEAVTSVTTNTTGHVTAIDVSTVTIPTDPGGTVKGTGTATRVAFWSASDTITSDADLYWDNTNKRLGIGDTSPQGKLEVNNRNTATGAALFIKGGEDDLDPVAGQYTGLAFGYGGGDIYNNASILWEFTNTAANGKLHFAVNPTAGDGTANLSDSKMTILDSGNVGIGDTSPQGKLEVSQNMSNGAVSAFTSPHLRLSALNTADSTGFVGMTFATSSANNYGFSWGALRTVSALGGMHLRYHANSSVGTDIFNIDYTGNVTIASTRYIRSDSSSGYLTIQGGATFPGGRIDMYGGSSASAGIEFMTGGATASPTLRLRIDGDTDDSYFTGNLGIGTTNPGTKLVIEGANDAAGTGVVEIKTTGTNLKIGGNTTYSWIQSHSSKPLYINQLGNNVILNLGGGRVGIGTDSPSDKLSVYNGSYAVNIGGYSASWSGNSIYPTIYGSSSDRWIMITSPHIPYLENGVDGYTGSTAGSRIRFASDSGSGIISWDAGVPHYGAVDTFTIGRNSVPFVTVKNNGNVGIGRTDPDVKLSVTGSGTSGQDIVMVLTSLSLRPVLQFSESTGQTINAGMSIEYNGTGSGVNNYFSFNAVTGASAATLTSGGTFTAVGDIVAYSDERLKSNIETLDGSKVYKMRGVSFNKDGKKSSGVIAQEMQKIAPELVNEDMEYLGVAYGNLTGYLIEAIKELKAEIEELKLNNCNCNK